MCDLEREDLSSKSTRLGQERLLSISELELPQKIRQPLPHLPPTDFNNISQAYAFCAVKYCHLD